MKSRLLTIYVANVFDLAATLLWVGLYGVGIEGNPFGRALLAYPPAAIAYKLLAVGLLLIILWRLRGYMTARIGSWVLLIVYAALAAYHITIILTVGGWIHA